MSQLEHPDLLDPAYKMKSHFQWQTIGLHTKHHVFSLFIVDISLFSVALSFFFYSAHLNFSALKYLNTHLK